MFLKNPYDLFLLFISALNMFFGISVLIQNPRRSLNVHFSLIVFALSLWIFFIYLVQVVPILFVGKLLFISASFIPLFFIAFANSFVSDNKQKMIGPDFVMFVSLCCFIDVLIINNYIINVVLFPDYGVAFGMPPTYFFFPIYFLISLSYGFIKLIRNYKKLPVDKKMQVRYFFAGTFLAACVGGTSNIIIPLLTRSQSLYSLGAASTLFIVVFTAYAITKHHLMDISIVISRFFAELLTIILYVFVYLGLVWLFKMASHETVNWLFILMTIAMGILVGQTHQTIRIFIQTTSDKLFLRGKYDYYKELSDVTSKVGEKMSLMEILKVLYSTFTNVIELSNSRIFLPEYFSDNEKSSKAYVIYDKANFQPLMNGVIVPFDTKWLKAMIDKRAPLHEVKEVDAYLVVPCFVEERLIGFFALGRKLSEDAYTDEDLRLLRALANQAAMALDHTRSYEKIRADLELVERQLERSQRLASLGTLTAGVTHEIRNPLTVIRGETERLLNQPRDAEYLANFRDLLLKHIDRISGIVNRMLDLAKEKPKQKIAVDLNELINSTLPLLSLGSIKVTTELTASQSINGDPEALQEVIINLLQNAIDSMPHGGQLSIKTYQENNRTVVEINDTGKGIPLEIREKIFDPFFSSRHEGVGLGLSIAYRIVREHDGDISVTSEVGKGSTFKLEF